MPLIDLRAPVEFNKGAFPGAVNLPLLNDSERDAVGIAYKTDGQQAAVDLGHQLISGATRRARIDAWLALLELHPEAQLYCFPWWHAIRYRA